MTIITNIRLVLGLFFPLPITKDYKQMDHQKALDDFKDRVKAYEQVYEVSTYSSEKSSQDKNFNTFFIGIY